MEKFTKKKPQEFANFLGLRIDVRSGKRFKLAYIIRTESMRIDIRLLIDFSSSPRGWTKYYPEESSSSKEKEEEKL